MKQQSKKQKIIAKTTNTTPPKPHSLEELPTIDSLLSITIQDRPRKVEQLFNKVKPFLNHYLQKKQGSRVVQLMFKWGDQTIQNQIYQCINKNWKELLKSKYAIYMMVKISKEKHYPLEHIVEDCILLQQNRQTAQILQNYIRRNVEAEDVKQIRNKFIQLAQKAQQGDLRSEEIMQNTSIKIIQCQYHTHMISKLLLKLAIKHLFEEERNKTLQFLVENIAEIVNDEDGVRLFIEMINYCSPKQKKTLLKMYKGYTEQIINNNNVSYVSIIKLITQTDDTVLLGKSIIEEIIALIPKILQCKKLFSIIFSLFSPRNHNFNILGKYQPNQTVSQCKKTENQRKKQLRSYLYTSICQYFKGQLLKNLLKDPNQGKLIIGIIKSMLEDNYDDKNKFISEFIKLYTDQLKQYSSNKNKMKFEDLLISHPHANKILKNILSIHDEQFDVYCDRVAQSLIKNIHQVLQTKASYVLLGLIEKGGRDELLKEVKKCGVKIQKAIAGEHYAKLLRDTKQITKPKKSY